MNEENRKSNFEYFGEKNFGRFYQPLLKWGWLGVIGLILVNGRWTMTWVDELVGGILLLAATAVIGYKAVGKIHWPTLIVVTIFLWTMLISQYNLYLMETSPTEPTDVKFIARTSARYGRYYISPREETIGTFLRWSANIGATATFFLYYWLSKR